MFAWSAARAAVSPGGLRRWARRLAAVLLAGAAAVACGGVGYAVGWPVAPVPGVSAHLPSGWGVRPPPGLPGFGRFTARHVWPSGLPGIRRPLRCPHGLGRALPALGPRSCERSVRAAACAPLRSVDVSGSIATVRTADNAPVLRRLTAMASRSCGAPAPRLPAPPLPEPPTPRPPQPPTEQPGPPHTPPRLSVPPALSVKSAAPRPVAWPRHAPDAEVAAPAGLPTATALFLVLLPAVVAGVAAGARSVSRGR
ncbi:hypothetical protein ACFOSC_07175 [Streptantibioticus rubrisoli]|uniref:Uncharacterized protein n=1 Tax=Streptantibioticus rubrisoli TaxID=1387313 RepID=A0ABT1P6Z4_9ACTN|nr:hypothetical protein [Streptantibioticus rubrisoli]MCQ4041142.1 hypothetical protein [Streptantibioticus rubrisoli]